jgi:hypothetical protein
VPHFVFVKVQRFVDVDRANVKLQWALAGRIGIDRRAIDSTSIRMLSAKADVGAKW